MEKFRRRNYLIDKPFQFGFIVRYMIIVVVTISISIGITATYYWVNSSFGIFRLNRVLSYSRQGQETAEGKLIYVYEKESVDVIKESPGEYRCYFKYAGAADSIKIGDTVQIADKTLLKPKIVPITKITTRFKIVFLPLVFTGIALILIQSVFSIFFSHRMAGPIYRIKVSLDRMIEKNDYNFKIRVRKNDFFENIADRLDTLRDKIFKEKGANTRKK